MMDSTISPVGSDAAEKIYRALNVGKDSYDQHREIRVLTLLPNSKREAQIVCTLKTVALKQHASYTTLSYTWGDAQNSREILVDNHRFSTTINLHKALTQFRDAKVPINLWVDAICINQKDLRERDSQVQLMQEIFSHARRTWLWLGEEADQSAKAIDLIQSLSAIYLKSCKGWDTSPESADKRVWGSLESHSTTEELVALNDLLARKYWYRIWVVQEIAVSSEIVIFCGERSFSWDALLFTAYLLDQQVEYRELIQDHRPRKKYVQGIQSGIQRIMSIQSVRNDFQGSSPDGKRDSLLFLLSNHRATEATEPKDKYIALAGLVAEFPQAGLRFYDKYVSLKDVYTFACYHLAYQSISSRQIKSLDFLDCAGGHSINSEWPSWVPDWSILGGRATPLLYWQFAAKLNENTVLYNVAGKVDPTNDPTFNFGQASGKAELQAKGFVFDTVESVSFSTKPPMENLKKKGTDPQTYLTGQLSDVLWKTCVLDRSHTGQKAPPDWANLFYQHLLPQSESSNTLSLLSQWYNQNKGFTICGRKIGDIVQEQQNSTERVAYAETTLTQFKTAFVNAVGYRKLATTAKGYLCLVPQNAEVGDSIVILLDCNVPVVLRPRGSEYSFLGTCYVHGIMHGEGVSGLDLQTFNGSMV
jgi:hypothetical protein